VKKQKKEHKIMGEKIHIQTEAMTRAFQRLIQLRDPNARWRFTYSVSLSAEPIAEVMEKVEPEKEVAKK